MKRVLFVLEGAGIQEVVRGKMYRPLLEARGVEAAYVSRRPVTPGSHLAGGQSRWARALSSSLEWRGWQFISDRVGTRFNHSRIAHMAAACDVIVLVKVRSLSLVQEIRRRFRGRLVYDMGDALWLPNHAAMYPDLEAILKSVDCVTTDNEFALSEARRYNSHVALWPPTSQVELFDEVRSLYPKSQTSDRPVVLGWIGTPSTAFHLYHIWEVLEELFSKEDGVQLRLVGVGDDAGRVPPFEGVRYSTRPRYSSEDMVTEVLGMDIGLFPMFDVADAHVRGVLKALVYMAGEAAVVCSPRGECKTLIRDGENGFLANTHEEWLEKLTLLIRHSALRKRLAACGLATVRSRYSLQQSFDHLYAALSC